MSKKYLSKFAVIAAVAAASQGAFAAANDTGTVNFEGEIVNSICSIAPESQNMKVFLGKIAAKTFKAAGDESLPADFTIKLLDCPAPDATTGKASVATVTFLGQKDRTDATLLLIDNAGQVGGVDAAKGVGIEISDSANTRIDMGAASGGYNLGEGTNSLRFKANYKSTVAAVTAGPANASTTFQVDYK
jgi:major type 1 subunit fimbrin (pilin)